MSRGLALAAALLLASFVAGCGDVCEDAAQICADERRVAAPDDDERGERTECEGMLEQHAQCIAEAGSCAPDIVAGCWEAAGGDPG